MEGFEKRNKRDNAIEFAYWIQHNWIVPAKQDDMWVLDVDRVGFNNTIGLANERELMDTEELYGMFKSGVGGV